MTLFDPESGDSERNTRKSLRVKAEAEEVIELLKMLPIDSFVVAYKGGFSLVLS